MNLHEITDSFVGGQLESKVPRRSKLYRGEIERIVIQNTEMTIDMAWNARAEGDPPEKWVREDVSAYSIDLEVYDSAPYGEGGVILKSLTTDDTIILYPKDDETNINPSNVEGLDREE